MGTGWPGTARRAWSSAKALTAWAVLMALMFSLLSLPVAIAVQAVAGRGLLLIPSIAATTTFPAAIILSLRDRIRLRRRENARPVEDRIAEIRQAAASKIDALPKLRDRLKTDFPDNPAAWSWVEPVVEYNRRLEALAASPASSSEDAMKLTKEAHQFLRRNRVRGTSVAELAYRLSRLLEQRQSRPAGKS